MKASSSSSSLNDQSETERGRIVCGLLSHEEREKGEWKKEREKETEWEWKTSLEYIENERTKGVNGFAFSNYGKTKTGLKCIMSALNDGQGGEIWLSISFIYILRLI